MRPQEELRIGWVPLARTTFDIPLAVEVAAQARSQLVQAGLTILGPETLVTDLEQAHAAAKVLVEAQERGDPVDLLLVLQATFADSTLVMALAEKVHAPLMLWAVPEGRTGSRLRLNSFCGINLAAHALTRRRFRYDFVYGAPGDPAAVDEVRILAEAGRAWRLLRQARIGRVGEHPVGLDSCQFEAQVVEERLGAQVVSLRLEDAFAAARAADGAQVDATLSELHGRIAGLDSLDPVALRGTLSSYHALRALAEEQELDGLAVRCWPEFFTELGCAACGAMSMLSDELTPCSCEADVHGTITQLILQWLSGEAAFGTDIVSVDVEEDLVVVWHCGLAPLSMADPAVRPRGTIHSNRQLPLLMEFPLKPGRVTVARLSEAQGEYRLVVGAGEVVRAPMSFTGTSGVIRFDRPAAAVLDTLLGEGLEHHISLTYGDQVPALLALAKLLDLPVLRLA